MGRMKRSEAAEGGAEAAAPKKSVVVREALRQLGDDAKLDDIIAFGQKTYGLTLTKSIVSNYKSITLKKGRGGAAAPRGGPGTPVLLEDLEAVKGLVGRLGADHVRRLVELIG